jgi:hypothetical protein
MERRSDRKEIRGRTGPDPDEAPIATVTSSGVIVVPGLVDLSAARTISSKSPPLVEVRKEMGRAWLLRVGPLRQNSRQMRRLNSSEAFIIKSKDFTSTS